MKETLTTRSKRNLYVAFTAIGFASGLVGKELIDPPPPIPQARGAEIQAPTPVPTQGILYEATTAADIRNFLFPSQTPTTTPYPTSVTTPYPENEYCNDDTIVGTICKKEAPPPPTLTPTLPCDNPDVKTGQKCIYNGTPVAGGN